MCTRFHDDASRIQKALEMSTYTGRYQLDTPGPGVMLPYIDDAQIRLQSWGANLCDNVLDIENSLRGTAKYKTKDGFVNPIPVPKYDKEAYPKQNAIVDDSRMSHPAWSYRDVDMKYSRWEEPWLNPQNWNVLKPLAETNIGSRMHEKDIFSSNMNIFR